MCIRDRYKQVQKQFCWFNKKCLLKGHSVFKEEKVWFIEREKILFYAFPNCFHQQVAGMTKQLTYHTAPQLGIHEKVFVVDFFCNFKADKGRI